MFVSSVVFCPPLPYWSETEFNSTDNNFLSVVTYWCNDGYAFKGHTSKPGNETVLSSMCLASKQWYPSILDCRCTYMITILLLVLRTLFFQQEAQLSLGKAGRTACVRSTASELQSRRKTKRCLESYNER